jgi:hypothetical protein
VAGAVTLASFTTFPVASMASAGNGSAACVTSATDTLAAAAMSPSAHATICPAAVHG